ncbi:transcriptional regulator (plasmid) [Cupriavidus necator N-1]|uniref:Transcriptional regulator n=1 Tax=Cupriavidus necator (strain ATCC 43291 / DSM 13513 / CCUG 52238 / LMG 8453 / N-1) TaxID=1042878 RepID=F8GVI0_CUPNN|nr:helix-turn-helix transcriptional regulator [Cupriavidus necator]AEI81539.1 transcriptional regulator [Cupriavidus necator N-1]MDX6007911.1 helix-turn-helix transcriptional regulator [Cupriavidus necator]
MPAFTDTTSVLERHLLLQLGDRIKRLRKAQNFSTVEMAKRVGISRTTLASVEAGDPAPTMGTYLRVMSVLGVAGDLALLASDTFQPPPANSAAASSKRTRPQVQVMVTTDPSRHQAQDLQSMALHKEAIRMIHEDPALLGRTQEMLRRWRSQGDSRSDSLWSEWETILANQSWRKALGRTRRAQELRQASPLPAILPDALRQDVLAQIQALKKGVVIGDQE